jgi:pullulanase
MRILDSCRDFDADRWPVIYIENHDHSTLIEWIGFNICGRSRWWRTQPALIALLTSPGAVLFHGGMEWAEHHEMPEPGTEDGTGTHRILMRPLHWSLADDKIGQTLGGVCRQLIGCRVRHGALRSRFMYPSNDFSCHFNDEGYGFDQGMGVVVIKRWDEHEAVVVVINYSGTDQMVWVKMPARGNWTDELGTASNQWSDGDQKSCWTVPGNWGLILAWTGT